MAVSVSILVLLGVMVSEYVRLRRFGGWLDWIAAGAIFLIGGPLISADDPPVVAVALFGALALGLLMTSVVLLRRQRLPREGLRYD
jgi:hypothetical protein